MIDDLDPGILEECVEDINLELQSMELSECAFYGTNDMHTIHIMKVNGSVNSQVVRILLDSGSFHNFINSKLLKHWGQHAQSTQSFQVMIVDGGMVTSSGCCRSAFLSLRGYNCKVDLYSFPLGGCDVVLGVHWLSTVSIVLLDFQLFTMQFTKNQKKYKLSHNPFAEPFIQVVSLHHIDKELLNTYLGLFLYSIKDQKVQPNALTPIQLQDLQDLTEAFDELFVLPS